MRQNLTNVKETQLDKVDSFYIVGSTTKEGLIEGRSNVKIDLKKAVVEGGGGGGSSEAQEVFDTLFGQTPYFVKQTELQEEVEAITFSEAVAKFDSGESTTFGAIYKERSPAEKIMGISKFIDGSLLLQRPQSPEVIMMELPEGYVSGGPWYYPEPISADLTGFPIPTTRDNPTILTGIEIPDSESANTISIAVLEDNKVTIQHYDKTGTDSFSSGGLALEKIEGVWIWKVQLT